MYNFDNPNVYKTKLSFATGTVKPQRIFQAITDIIEALQTILFQLIVNKLHIV